ncbi:protein disulfide isomerase CRELD1-like [Octopus sinensis]|uniref:Protein disulfide isomerase CRELD1-like n=1 Tax=Octopus sinensis TaxID=2607531 RepID=A0A7E6EIL3_9MOLL|nr:protein disulfide isomerase CRELD1-like [Octopus sinensis]
MWWTDLNWLAIFISPQKMADTAGLNYEGGDPTWQQKNLAAYKDSEMRLYTILENICHNKPNSNTLQADQCNSFLGDVEDDLVEWWSTGRGKKGLFQTLCVDMYSLCCPFGHYGPHCHPCPADLGPHCSCNVETGLITRGMGRGVGQECVTVGRAMWARTVRNARLATSGRCSPPCDQCSGGEYCDLCGEGYVLNEERKCVDIDECNERPCGRQGICINIPGSYHCSCGDGLPPTEGPCYPDSDL